MKKLISMMLMLCAIITFSACSSSDDPVNPISNPVVPTSAKIGSEVTVQGSGFATGQTLYLQPEAGEAVDMNAKMTSNGATFTVPYTMSEGKVNVVLKNGNDSWTLGSMTLLAAENPISALALPSEMALGNEVTIAGLGFADGDRLFLSPIAITKAVPVLDNTIAATVTSDGLKFTVPTTLAESNYEVTLVRGKSSWNLGETYIYQAKRIKSIYFENGLLAMIGAQSITMDFTYNTDGTIAEISSQEGLGWKFTYDGNVVKSVSPLSDTPLEFTMEDGKVVKSIAAKAEDEYETTKYDYWTYNSDNTLASVTNKDQWYRGLQLTDVAFEDGNLSSFSFGGDMKFTTDKSFRAIPGTIDVRYLLDLFSYVYAGEDIFVGLLLNKQSVNSAYMPTKAQFGYMDVVNDEYVTKWADVNLNTAFKDNVLTIDFLSFKDLEMVSGTYGSKIVVTYEAIK